MKVSVVPTVERTSIVSGWATRKAVEARQRVIFIVRVQRVDSVKFVTLHV